MRALGRSILLATTVLACSFAPSQADAGMCNVAHDLAVAASVTGQASVADAAGDKVTAQQLASQARTTAEDGHRKLQDVGMAEGVRQSPTWQALLDAYLHIGQAANALLPGFEGTYGMTDSELATGRDSLAKAAAALPGGCVSLDQP